MRHAISFVVVMMLAGASLEGQAGPRGSAQPVKPVRVETPPIPVPAAKPVVDTHAAPVAGTQVAPAKPVVQPAAKPVAQATPVSAGTAQPAKPPVRTLEQAAESIAAALAARGVKPAPRPPSDSPAPRIARAPRVPRYSLRWLEDDLHWDVQWPVVSNRVALTWPESDATSHPASD